METVFSAQGDEKRKDVYFRCLIENPEIHSLKMLLLAVEKEYPNDDTVNYNRIQRDICKIRKNNNLHPTKSLEDLRSWIDTHYLFEDDQNYISKNVKKFKFVKLEGKKDKLIDEENAREGYLVFVRTPPYGAEQMAYKFRSIYSDEEPFVLSNYDSVLMYFPTEQQYRAFRSKFDPYSKSITNKSNKGQ